MKTVGIRELRQQASAVIARVVEGESVVISDRGRPVARLVPLSPTRYETLRDQGRVRLPKSGIAALPQAKKAGHLTSTLADLRDEERY